jgi:hypothetical protein
MKKIICFILLIITMVNVMGCESAQSTSTASTTISTTSTTSQTSSSEITTNTTVTTQPTTTLRSINFNFGNFEGEGTISNPYEISVTVNETFSKVINFGILSSHLVYDLGNIVSDDFIINNDIEGVIIEESNDFSLVIEAINIGEYYIRVSSLNSIHTYIKVNVEEYVLDFTKNLKVLAIGNSFSVDGMEYLYKIADDYGIPNITLGILYIPGAALSTHVYSIDNSLNNYVYYKNTSDIWNYHNSTASLLDGLLDENWDIITIQQVSGYSGLPSTYNNDIDTIINYVNDNKTNSEAQIVWHMTWAYQANSTHSQFASYSNNQLTMYNAIIGAVQEKIDIREDIAYVIPSGTAIQNARTSYLGDTITRDGYHLSLYHGRYIAALTWFLKITGLPVDGITYKPLGVSDQDVLLIKEAVKNAVENPYTITESSYPPTDV